MGRRKVKKFTVKEIQEDLIPKAERGEYGDESKLIEKALHFFLQVVYDKGLGNIPFICGAVGKKDTMGLHEGYFICPCYGVDVSVQALYKKIDK